MTLETPLAKTLKSHQEIVSEIRKILGAIGLESFVKRKYDFWQFIPDVVASVGCGRSDRVAIDALGTYGSFNRVLGGLMRIKGKVRKCFIVVDDVTFFKRLSIGKEFRDKIQVISLDDLAFELANEVLICLDENQDYYQFLKTCGDRSVKGT